MDAWELVARESIRDLVARYNANGDSGRFEQMLELFAPDAVMEVSDVTYKGRDEIATIFTSAAERLRDSGQHSSRASGTTPQMRHHTATLQIDVAEPTFATARCYFQVVMGHGLDHWGRYLDAFGVVDGRWRFTKRRVVVDGMVAGSWAGTTGAGTTGAETTA